MPESRTDSPEVRPRRRRILWLVLIVVVVAAVAWVALRPGASTEGRRARGGAGGPGGMSAAQMLANVATPVKVATAISQDLPIYLRSLGTVTAYNTVTVRSRVSGELVDVPFVEGQRVKAGDLLAQVDPRAFKVQLDQALGTQQQNQALLANARRDLARYQTLFKQDSIARQQLDTQAALVSQYEGTQKTDQANVDSARLQVDYARITAPIDGRLGLRQVDRGNLVSTSDTNGVVVITQTQPISVLFTLPETQLPEVLKQVRAGNTLEVDAYDRADTRRIATGKLETLDNQIDVATGTLRLKARFDNADETLFPNQFVNVRLLVQTRQAATSIPTVAAQQGSSGAFVFVVKDDNTVEVRLVELGPIFEDRVAVNTGLSNGERVVVEGTDRLRQGAKVTVSGATDTVAPGTGAAPAPANGRGRGLGAGAPAGTAGPATRKP